MIKRILRSLYSFLFLLLLLFFFLTRTQAGLQVLIAVGAHFLPASLEIEEINGYLLGPIHLKNLYYEDEKNQIVMQAEEIDVKWHFIHFFPTVIGLSTLQLTNAHLQLNKQYEPHIQQLTLQGKITCLPNLSWDLAINGQQLNIGIIKPAVKSNLSLQMQTQGVLNSVGNTYHISLISLRGQLDKFPLSGEGSVAINQDQYRFQQVKFNLGKALAQINGIMAPKQTNLTWQLNIPNLHAFIPMAKGQIESQGIVGERVNQPHIVGQLRAKSLVWNKLSLQNLDANLDAYANWNQLSQLHISLSQLLMGQTVIHALQLDVQNQQKQNKLALKLSTPDLQLTTQAKGKIIQTQWQGEIEQFNVNVPKLGSIGLKESAKLVLTSHSFHFQPFCLQGVLGNLCIEQAQFATQIRPSSGAKMIGGDIQLSSQDLSFINAFFPMLANITGNLKANFHITGSSDDPLVSGQAIVSNGKVEVPQLGVTLNDIQLKATGNKDSLNYVGQATLGPGTLHVNGKSDLSKEDFPTQIQIKGNDLLVMNTADAVVRASSDLALSWLNSLLSFTGTITIPYARITPRDFTSTVTLPNDVIFVTDDEETKQSALQMYSQIKINLGEDIWLNYAGLSGKIVGSIRVEDKPGGDTMGSGTLAIQQGKYKAYGQNLIIQQGKFIYTGGPVNNPGLNIEAIKRLQVVTSSASGKSMGSGYSNSSQIVGLRVTGTLTQPSTRLFSEPAGLSQSDILSYLILGRPASQATQDDSPNILQALSLLNLGGGETGQLKNQFANAFGLSQLSLSHEQEYDAEENSVVENTSLLLGKTLSPRLLVTYSLGLVEPINTLKIVYKLRNNISLQSEHTANANGVDLFYTIER